MTYNFKSITVVPESKEFVDIILSKTQRKTPTVIHKGYEISRIRKFYVRKVKFTQKNIHERLSKIIEEFPKADEIHPFYGDLINVLYDRDHYKVALGQISAVRHIVDTIGRDYVRLLKYGDSLYRCKHVKRAALGRMATILRKLGPTLSYLEQVRQHLSRLPSIDPNTRTLLICGFPNVGKSSFLNRVSRADVEVQPYAFTTKSLYVGHTYYKYASWQVIDTPGILDHTLDERNVIEMQSITALAYLHATIMYFMDLSEQCGYSIESQVSLFKNIFPLFAGKPIVIIFNKSDLMKLESLSPEQAEKVQEIIRLQETTIPYIETSTLSNDGVGELKALACDLLLNHSGNQTVTSDTNEVYWAQPAVRDNLQRKAIQPECTSTSSVILEKDLEAQLGGAGVYFPSLSKHYILRDDQWKDDVIPQILDGMNIMDYIDDDILQKLSEIEMEEENYNSKVSVSEEKFELDSRSKIAVQTIKSKISVRKIERALSRSRTSTAPKNRHMKEAIERQRESIGGQVDNDSKQRKRGRTQSSECALQRERSSSSHVPTKLSRSLSKQSSVRPLSVARGEGYKDVKDKLKTVALAKKSRLSWSNDGRKGEADRSVPNLMPKHLFQGKMTLGKRRSR